VKLGLRLPMLTRDRLTQQVCASGRGRRSALTATRAEFASLLCSLLGDAGGRKRRNGETWHSVDRLRLPCASWERWPHRGGASLPSGSDRSGAAGGNRVCEGFIRPTSA